MTTVSSTTLLDVSMLLEFGELIAAVADISLYVHVEQLRTGRMQATNSKGVWLNESLALAQNYPELSTAPLVARVKSGELLVASKGHPQYDAMLLTPLISREKRGSGWAGGAMYGTTLVGASKLAALQDKMFAAVLAYASMDMYFDLHHFGMRYSSRGAWEQVVNTLLKLEPDRTWVLPSDDHLRVYNLVGQNRRGASYFVEHQLFENSLETHGSGIHWDFMVSDPAHFLRILALAFGVEPVVWGEHAKDPYGMVKLPAIEGQIPWMVMARSYKNPWVPEAD